MDAPGFLRHTNQRRGAGKAFKAPGAATGAAGRAGHILNDHVPQFRCRAGVAGQNLAVQHNTTAHAGAQGHNNGTLGALSTPRKCLAKCSDIGIIPNHHRQVRLSLQVAAYLKIVPIEVVGIQHCAAVHCAGAADADSGDIPACGQLIAKHSDVIADGLGRTGQVGGGAGFL